MAQTRTHGHAAATLLLVASLAMSLIIVMAAPAQALDPDVRRVDGINRYATAVEVSQASWPQGASTVYIVTGSNFADAVSAVSSAAKSGPVLLVERTSIPSSTLNEIRRLEPELIVVVGGPQAVGDGVLVTLAREAFRTTRLWGQSRFETAAAVSQFAFPTDQQAPVDEETPDVSGTTNVDVAFLASGLDYRSALAAAGAAGAVRAPILLSLHDRLPTSTAGELARLRPQQLIVTGDAGLFTDAVINEAGTYATDVTVAAGTSPEQTAAVLSELRFQVDGVRTAFLATTENFADALTGGAYAGTLGVPLLFVNPNGVDESVKCELVRLGATDVVLFGGPAALSSSIADEIDAGFEAQELRGCDQVGAEVQIPEALTQVAGAPLTDVEVSADGRYAYIVNNRLSQIEVVDLATEASLDPIGVGSLPVDAAITPVDSSGDQKLFVTNSGSKTITVIDLDGQGGGTVREDEIRAVRFGSLDDLRGFQIEATSPSTAVVHMTEWIKRSGPGESSGPNPDTDPGNEPEFGGGDSSPDNEAYPYELLSIDPEEEEFSFRVGASESTEIAFTDGFSFPDLERLKYTGETATFEFDAARTRSIGGESCAYFDLYRDSPDSGESSLVAADARFCIGAPLEYPSVESVVLQIDIDSPTDPVSMLPLVRGVQRASHYPLGTARMAASGDGSEVHLLVDPNEATASDPEVDSEPVQQFLLVYDVSDDEWEVNPECSCSHWDAGTDFEGVALSQNGDTVLLDDGAGTAVLGEWESYTFTGNNTSVTEDYLTLQGTMAAFSRERTYGLEMEPQINASGVVTTAQPEYAYRVNGRGWLERLELDSYVAEDRYELAEQLVGDAAIGAGQPYDRFHMLAVSPQQRKAVVLLTSGFQIIDLDDPTRANARP